MKKESDLIKGTKGMAWMSSVIMAEYIINLLITYILARILTPSDYGEVSAITILVGFADLFWQLGVGPALVQKKNLTEKDIATGHTLNIIFGFVTFAVVNIFAGFCSEIFSISSVNMLRVYSLIFIINSVLATPMSIAQKKCKFKLMAFVTFSSVIIYGGVAVFFAKLGYGAWTLVYANLIKLLYRAVAFVIAEKINFRFMVDKESAKSLLYFGGGHTLARIFNYIANNGDSFVINKTLGKVDLGNYTKAHSLLNYPATLIGQSLDQVLFPILSGCQDEIPKLKRTFNAGTGIIALFAIPISVVCYFCAEDLILFYLGEGWISVALPFKVMISGLFFRTAYKLSDSVIRAIGKVYQRSVVQIIYASLVVLTTYIGHFFGLWAIAFGVTFSFIANYFMMYLLCAKYIKIKLRDALRALLPAVLYGGVSAVVLMLCMKLFINNLSSHFAVCVADTIVVFAVYFGLLITTRKYTLTKEMNGMFDTVIGSIKRKLIKK